MTNKIGWNFDNTYTKLPGKMFSKVMPTPVSFPDIAIFNSTLAKDLGLNGEELKSNHGAEILGGNTIPSGAEPIAQAYAGHQFGHFTMLGDGRAILLGEHISPDGKRFDLQLKGAGRTPYSRGGDGRAALGPMLREYLISEAMHALRIPTTRSLAVVKTGEAVIRETHLPGAILTRVASSHIRVGTFQFIANWGTVEELKEFADYTIERHYPEVKDQQEPYLVLLQKVIENQASLISKWMLIGFIHGVMNTDNMTISGETIDYGPCAFMDTYHPSTVFSSIDIRGRYAYANQPTIGGWNLARFAESLLPILHDNQDEAVKKAQEQISNYPKLYQQHWINGMKKKLGLLNDEENDKLLIDELLNLMKNNKADFTNTFLALTYDDLEKTELHGIKEFEEWYKKWQERLIRQEQLKEEIFETMKIHNPVVIPRNHRVEEALEAAVELGDYTVLNKLLHVLSNPFEYDVEKEEYCKVPERSDEPYQTFCGT